MSIDKFTNDDAGVNFYTGLETLTTFYFVLRTLGPAAHCLNYIYRRVSNIGGPDQFFLVFCKLRRHITNFERSRLFGVSEKTVSKMYYIFLHGFDLRVSNGRKLKYGHQSSLLSTTVHQIKKNPNTRVIRDGTILSKDQNFQSHSKRLILLIKTEIP